MKAESGRAALEFPPKPRSFRARGRELDALAAAIVPGRHARIALVGAGGSGKSTLAIALGHKVRERFPGGIQWFRVGAWDTLTLTEMLALRFRVTGPRTRRLARVRAHLRARGETLIVLDNHEDDRAVAALLDALRDAPVTWVITARRCLLAGVTVHPVVPPLVTLHKSPFPAVASLTRLLRWNPVALDIADAVVTSGAVTADALETFLIEHGVDRVKVIEHEDDLPEVAILVAWAWAHLSPPARRMMAVLAHMGGDHMDTASLAKLAKAGAHAEEALAELQRLRVVQEPLRGRLALHATVRHAVLKRTKPDHPALFEHYVSMLESAPERVDLEHTHLFAAMDHAHVSGDLNAAIRVERLLSLLEERAG